MKPRHAKVSRREFLKQAGIVTAGVLASSVASCVPAPAQPSVPPAAPAEPTKAAAQPPAVTKVNSITIQINDSPWLPAFDKETKMYQQETGIQVNLNVTPFNGMLQKSRNAVQAPESEFDLINLNEQWYMPFYANGWVTPLKEIDPSFQLDSNLIEYEYATRWDPKARYSTKNGEVYGIPINGNFALFYYRTDVFKEKNIAVPKTWDEVEAAAKILHNPPNVYGWANRTNPPDWELQAWMHGYGGGWLKLDEASGEWVVTVASESSLTALKRWLAFGKLYGPPNQNDISQADLISLMSSGKVSMVCMADSGAGTLRDPAKSTVVGKVAATPFIGPKADQRATMSGIWVMGIPSNLPTARKQAGLKFLTWLTSKNIQVMHAKGGGSPVRRDVYQELANDPDVGWVMQAMNESVPYIKGQPRFSETAQFVEIFNRRTGEALIGKLSPEEAMKEAAKEIHAVLTKGNYKVKPLS